MKTENTHKILLAIVAIAVGITSFSYSVQAQSAGANRPDLQRRRNVGVNTNNCQMAQVYCTRPDGNSGPITTMVCPPRRPYQHIGPCPRH
jgi:hypothetical protein